MAGHTQATTIREVRLRSTRRETSSVLDHMDLPLRFSPPSASPRGRR